MGLEPRSLQIAWPLLQQYVIFQSSQNHKKYFKNYLYNTLHMFYISIYYYLLLFAILGSSQLYEAATFWCWILFICPVYFSLFHCCNTLILNWQRLVEQGKRLLDNVQEVIKVRQDPIPWLQQLATKLHTELCFVASLLSKTKNSVIRTYDCYVKLDEVSCTSWYCWYFSRESSCCV